MNKINYYYFCLYNLFYLDGFGSQIPTSNRAFSIEQRPVFIFSIGTWFWSWLIRLIIIDFFHPTAKLFSLDDYELLIPIISFIVYYIFFYLW